MAHNSANEADEIATMLRFLMTLAENGSQEYRFLKKYVPAIQEEYNYIWQCKGTDAHAISETEFGSGKFPVLRHFTQTEQNKVISLGCDFALNLREGVIEKIAKEHKIPKETIKLDDCRAIYFEITKCICETEQRVKNDLETAEKMPKGAHPMPRPSQPGLPKKQKKTDCNRFIEEANSKFSQGIDGDEAERLWAEKIALDSIVDKIKKYNRKLADFANTWATEQAKIFPTQLEPQQKENAAFIAQQAHSGAKFHLSEIMPSAPPTAEDWLENFRSNLSKPIWLVIRSDYYIEAMKKPEELIPYLIWQAGKHKLEDFSPFLRLAITTNDWVIMFYESWFHYDIWHHTAK